MILVDFSLYLLNFCDVVFPQVIPKFIALLERNRRWWACADI